MEYEGIGVDTAFLSQLSKEINTDLIALQTAIFEQAGESFNLSSPKQLGISFREAKVTFQTQRRPRLDNMPLPKRYYLSWLLSTLL